ncbi:heme NO-binding domain-containing protein [Caldicellulosiruptoraceae bacterium PP1]
MKGTVVLTWLETIGNIWGEDVKKAGQKAMGLDESTIISPTDDISDEDVLKMIQVSADMANIEPSEMFRTIGKNNIKTFSKWFPSYFERLSLKGFLEFMDDVHTQLTRFIKGAKPPRIFFEEISSNEAIITYVSKRGFYDYFLGLLEGSAEFFNEKLDFSELERFKDDQGFYHLKIHIKFTKTNKKFKKAYFNIITSLFIFRNLEFKISILSSIVAFLTSLVINNDHHAITLHLTIFTTTFVATFLASYLILKPLRFIKEELDSLKKLDFSGSVSLKTLDSIEKLAESVASTKFSVKKDLLLLKGGSDEINNFSKNIAAIAENMKKLSDTISSIVSDVASGAIHQAEEIEKAVIVLNDNIYKLNTVVDEQSKSKDGLISINNELQNSGNELLNVSNIMNNISNDFSLVVQRGQKLSNDAQDVMKITSTVAEIANQINMLALNASIEAARAGSFGVGFAVVADEIRKLADSTRNFAKTINNNLKIFVEEVEGLSTILNEQFEKLSQNEATLNEVANKNSNNIERISNITENIVSLIETLRNEAKRISDVFKSINSLSAISQENSASSQEMQAMVSEYAVSIKDLLTKVTDLESLSNVFKEELNKYRL